MFYAIELWGRISYLLIVDTFFSLASHTQRCAIYVYILFCMPFSFAVVRLAFGSKGDFMRMDVKNFPLYFIHSAILPPIFFIYSHKLIESSTHWTGTLFTLFGWLVGCLVYLDAFAKMLHDDYAQHAYFCIFYLDRRNTDLGSFIVQREQFFVLYSHGLSHKHTHKKMMRAKKCEKYIWIVTIGTNILFISAHFTYFSFEECFNSFATYSVFDEVLSWFPLV